MIKQGQVWKDNDPRQERYVKVMLPDDLRGNVVIRRCNPDGTQMEKYMPITKTKPERFGKKGRIGYTLVKDANARE